jgi:Hint domain
LCNIAGILNLDRVFCIVCALDLDGDGDEGEEPEDLLDNIIPDTSCFSGITTVQTPHGHVATKDLQLGDRVLTARGDFEPIYAWGHKHAS